MTKAILEHYRLLLTLKHTGVGFPSRISPAMRVFIAIYCALVLGEIANKENVLLSVMHAFVIAFVFLSFAPQVFAGLVLIKILELASVSLVKLISSHYELNMLSALPVFIYIYSTVCVMFLFFKCAKKSSK